MRAGLVLTAVLVCSPLRAAAADALPEPPPVPRPWYDALHFDAFVDAYASVNYGFPRPQAGTNSLRAYDGANGFALSWVGADVRADPDPVGGTLSLRFGPTAERRGRSCLSGDRSASPCDGDIGLANVDQAFAVWKPGGARGSLTLSFGKFAGIYGAELAESQHDFDYTRGLLYRYTVPWFLTGARASWAPSRRFAIDVLAVNGYNESVDNNLGKTFGVKASLAPSSWLDLSVGWLGGPEQDDQLQVACPALSSYSAASRSCAPDPTALAAKSYTVSRGGANRLDAWRHIVDLVARLRAGELVDVVLDATAGHEGVRDTTNAGSSVTGAEWYGASIAARWQFASDWDAAARVETLRDAQGRLTGFDGATFGSATLTLAARPSENLTLMLDNRLDEAFAALGGKDVFQVGARGRSDRQVTTTLGVVVSTE